VTAFKVQSFSHLEYFVIFLRIDLFNTWEIPFGWVTKLINALLPTLVIQSTTSVFWKDLLMNSQILLL